MYWFLWYILTTPQSAECNFHSADLICYSFHSADLICCNFHSADSYLAIFILQIRFGGGEGLEGGSPGPVHVDKLNQP